MTKTEFQKILTDYPEAVCDRQRLSNLLNDMFPQEPKLRRILLFLHEQGIHTDIEETGEITKQFAYRLFKRLIDEFDVSDENAYLGVYLWCSCYGEGVLCKPCDLKESYTDSFQVPSRPDMQPGAQTYPSNNTDTGIINTSREYEDFYVNVSHIKQRGRIYIPCSFDAKEYGYYICGIAERGQCTHEYADLYALVYNYIIRKSLMTEDDRPAYIKNREFPYKLNYSNVFRLITVILQLIKNNYIKETSVNVSFDGYINELKCAIDVINDYIFLFGRLTGISPCPILKHKTGRTSLNITLTGTQGIYVKNSESVCNAREIWYGRKIKYNLSENNLQDLEYLLSEISEFESFLPGQAEALRGVLSSSGNYLCAMPPGSGKSVIYYLASILQPLPVLIVMPRDDMIYQQIQNLRDKHGIDNVSHLRQTSIDAFRDFEICNNMIFLTPATFQNKGLLERFKLINDELQISYIVLDRAQSLSDRENDFRPESLMLCAKLTLLLGSVTFLALTSTNNRTVMMDIVRYLGVGKRNIYYLPGKDDTCEGADTADGIDAAGEAKFTGDELIFGLIKYYGELNRDEKAAFVDTYPADKFPMIKRYLYMLFVIGYVEDWYILSADEHGQTVNVMIVITTSEDYRFLKRGSIKMLGRVRKKSVDYLSFMGNSKDEIVQIKLAESIEAVISIFANWYYKIFLSN